MSNPGFFTLELTDNAVKIFDGNISQKQIEVKKISLLDNLTNSFFSQDTIDSAQKFSEMIKKSLAALKIDRKKVNLVIPDAYTYSQIITMPALNEKELISAIKYQADQFIPLPIEEINLDLQIIYNNEKEKKILVLVVAAPKKLVNRIEELTQLAGLIPNTLENQLSSFARFINQFAYFVSQNNSSHILFINLGQNSTSLYLFDLSISLVSKIHTFNLGYNFFLKELKINTALEDAKIKELLLSFDLKNKNPVDVETIISPAIKQFVFEIKKIFTSNMNGFFIGEIFRFPALSAIISKNLGASFSIFNPFPIIKQDQQVDHYKDSLPFFVTTFGAQI